MMGWGGGGRDGGRVKWLARRRAAYAPCLCRARYPLSGGGNALVGERAGFFAAKPPCQPRPNLLSYC